MILSRYTLNNIESSLVQVPDASLFDLPEKVLQFGTGVLLRGIPDYFIDRANRQGIFNGRIVVVSLTCGDIAAFHKQDCLFTVCSRGKEDGELLEEYSINSSISRVLDAKGAWQHVLECAHNPELKVVLSETTEAGIQMMNDDVRLHPPKSVAGKLLAFLFERFRAFGGSRQSGMIVVSTETIPDNRKSLETMVFELAHLNGLEDTFIEWLEVCNHFCSSLVDGSVREKINAAAQKRAEQRLGYKDRLLIIADNDCLWAIEGSEQVKAVLSFSHVDTQVFVTTTPEQFHIVQQNRLIERKPSPINLGSESILKN